MKQKTKNKIDQVKINKRVARTVNKLLPNKVINKKDKNKQKDSFLDALEN